MQIAISVAVLSLLSGGCRTAHQAETLPTTLEVAPRHDASHSQADSVPDTAAVRQVQFEQPEPIPSPEEVVIAERQMLTLSDLQSIAFANNPTLAAAAARIEAASGRQFQAGRYPNPVVGYQTIEMGLRDTAGQQGGFVSQRFITGGKLELDQMIAGQEMAEAEFQLLAQERRVHRDVSLRYYDALVAAGRAAMDQ